MYIKLKLPVLVGPLSAIQPPLTSTSPGHLATLRNYSGRSCPWRNYLTPGFVYSQHTAPMNIKTPSSQDTSSHLGQIEPRRFITCAQTNSCLASI